MNPIVLDGGLDLMSAKPVSQPGSLRGCFNYERGIRQGYTRAGAHERFDGQEPVSSYRIWRLKTTNASAAFNAGDAVYFESGQNGVVLDTALDDTVTSIYCVFHGSATETTLPDVLNGPSGKTATITSRETLFKPRGTQATLNTALNTLAAAQRSNITTVPGRTGSDIIGGFALKNRVYAIRDLCRLYFSAGYYTDANEGQFVTISGTDYEILDVTLNGDSSGFLTIDCASGSGDPATPIVTPTPGALALSGAFDDGYVDVSYSDSVSASGGTSPYTYSIVDGPGSVEPPVDPVDPGAPIATGFVGQQTNAALYRASASGWVRVDLGREIQFKQGGANLSNFIREATLDGATVQNSGFVFPTSSTLNGGATTGVNADDGTNTALTGASGDYIVAKTFDLSSIPSTAIIRGIEVVIERQSNTANAAKDHTVDLVGLGGTENKAKGANWPNTIGTATYGSQYDLWGRNDITVADLQSASFGVRLIMERADSGTAAIGGVDYIKVKVYYIERDTPAYVWNGTSDIEISIRHTQILAGDTGADTATGWMSITCDKNADKARLITEGDEIRTAASGGGNLIAVAAGRDRPIFFPGQEDIDNNRSRYQSISTNFWAQDDYDAAFIVCGVGPCIYFDGARTVRIRTQLPSGYDHPRHVARQGEMLALGFYQGVVYFSKVGNPFETRGDQAATTIEVGDRLTNLTPISGDALGVVCESSIYMIRGLTPSTFFKSTLTAKRGAFEYGAADIGKVLAYDGQGVFLVEAAENFGAAERMYISQKVTPWLEPRLQANQNSEQSQIRPIAGLAVRSKNQYRIYFWDGYVLTLTNEEPAQFTIQWYGAQSGNDEVADTPWPIRTAFTYIDANGRERIFGSFYGVNEGYLYELDAGRSFDGAVIPAYIELNPLDFGRPAELKRHDRVFLLGVGEGVATVDASRSKNYTEVDESISLDCSLGASTNPAVVTPGPLRGSVDLPIEGYDVTWRFDSSTAIEAPHTLQYATLFVDSRGMSRGHTRDS